MLEIVEKINTAANSLVWGIPALVCILGVGIYLSFSTGFVQIRYFALAMKTVIGNMFSKDKTGNGSISPFQAVCTALAATLGTGNIAGVAGAIAVGGPGAVFWMWISAVLGMCTKFAEVTLAVHYREKNTRGDYVGGPMYYIKNGLGKKWMWLAYTFAVLGILATFGIGNTTQISTMVSAIDTTLLGYNMVAKQNIPTLNLLIGIGVSILVGMVMLGGVKRIGSISEKLVPLMAFLYIILSLGVIVVNIERVPSVFNMILQGAFHPAAVTGGIVGNVFISMRSGIARGIFSNEAGLGSGSIAHACANTDEPVKQGFYGIFEVFADTLVICTLTAFVILCSDVDIMYGLEAGANLTISGFVATYGGWVTIPIALAMCLFAFATVIGWSLYGVRCLEFIAPKKSVKPFMVIFALMTIVGATTDLGILWELADIFNGLMILPNLLALFLLSETVVSLVKQFNRER